MKTKDWQEQKWKKGMRIIYDNYSYRVLGVDFRNETIQIKNTAGNYECVSYHHITII